MYLLHIGNELVNTTSDHPFFVGGRWLRVKDLRVGDSVATYRNTKVAIGEIQVVYKRTVVHNFEVEDYHTYYVSEQQFLVHNNKCPTGSKDLNQARNDAMDWLDKKGFKAEKPTPGKFGNKGKNIGMQTADGKTGFRIEHDARNGAHYNVWSGKEKGPHFNFNATEKTVIKIQKKFN